jgi:hypothetical protein
LKPHGHFSASPEERGGENGYLNPHEIYKFTNSPIHKFTNLQKPRGLTEKDSFKKPLEFKGARN